MRENPSWAVRSVSRECVRGLWIYSGDDEQCRGKAGSCRLRRLLRVRESMDGLCSEWVSEWVEMLHDLLQGRGRAAMAMAMAGAGRGEGSWWRWGWKKWGGMAPFIWHGRVGGLATGKWPGTPVAPGLARYHCSLPPSLLGAMEFRGFLCGHAKRRWSRRSWLV